MRYYLVALFDDDSYKQIEPIQKSLSRKYKLYKNLSKLYITLEVIEDPDVKKLDMVLNKIIRPYKRFKVELKDAVCFNEPYRALNLKVESKGYIKKIARNVNEILKLHGFQISDTMNKDTLHVSLANTNFSQKELKKSEYDEACNSGKTESFYNLAKIDRIELWKSSSHKKETIIKSYVLKTF